MNKKITDDVDRLFTAIDGEEFFIGNEAFIVSVPYASDELICLKYERNGNIGYVREIRKTADGTDSGFRGSALLSRDEMVAVLRSGNFDVS